MHTSAMPTNPPIVLVDDEADFLLTASTLLKMNGFSPVVTLQDGRRLLPFLEKNEVSAVMLDILMPDILGSNLLPEITRNFPGVPVLMVTAVNDVESAVQCMRQGAFDYLVKPVEETRFLSCMQRAMERRGMSQEIQALKASLLVDGVQRPAVFSSILTRSREMQAIFKYIEAVAHSMEPILVIGETGVGKELLVEAIHKASNRPGALVAVNVAGIDDTMFSDTLFGHKKGAFSGADQARAGMIAQAAGGTLVLDEIGDLEHTSQVKLLRLLQERKYYPLGSDVYHKTDARVVCATNKDLEQRIRDGQFRPDLFYRLSSHQVRVPPLRERKEDLPLLVAHFLEQAASDLHKSVPTPPPELFQWLGSYSFPGNIRELRAMINDAVARHDAGVLSITSFKNTMRQRLDHQDVATTTAQEDGASHLFHAHPDPLPTIHAVTEMLIQEVLRRVGGNQRIAASLLGISRHTLMRRLHPEQTAHKGRC
ncbi:MAG: sigma-54 dependent transcriptional regulator [Magnetococcus sp. MYC-9]